MNPGLVVKLRPAGPWRIGPDSGARNRVDAIYHSDSLYSAVTSAMSRMGLLEAWLDATARSQTSAVCFSSCFPFLDDIGFVVPPRTVWPPTSPQAMSARVRWKRARFIPLSVVESILSGKKLNENQWSVDGASGCLVPVGKAGPFRTSVRWNAAVDRLSGSSERHATACIEFREGCGLWTVAGFSDDAARDQWQDRVKAAFRLLADTGFGGERSRGWGRAETPEFVEGTLPGLIVECKRKEAAAPVVEPDAESSVPGPEPASASVSESEGAAPDLFPAASASLESEGTDTPIRAATVRERLTEAEPAPEPAPEVEGAAPETELAAEVAPEVDPAVPEVEPAAEVVPESEPGAEAIGAATVRERLPEAEPAAEPALEAAAPETAAPDNSSDDTPPQADVDRLKPVPPMQANDEPVVAPALPPANLSAPEVETAASEAAPESAASAEAAVRAPDRTEAMRVAAVAAAPSVKLQAHWLLSLFAPAANDAVDWGRGSYAVMARGGRIDSPSGSGELKKQIQMVAEGSVLFSDGVPLGAAPDVAPDGFAHPVFRAGFALAIRLPEVH